MKKYKFELAGVPHHVDEFFGALSYENEDYNLPLSEIKELYSDGDKIFMYDFAFSEISTIREDSNPYDSNAVRIDADGHVIGYIKKTETAAARKLLEEPCKATLEICGGPYKEIVDGKVVEKSWGYFATLWLSVGAEEAPAPAIEKPKQNTASLLIVGIALVLLGLLFLIVAWPLGLAIIAFGVFFLVNYKRRK